MVEEDMMPSFQESYAHLANGRPIYFFEEGAGLPLLLLHGGANDQVYGFSLTMRDGSTMRAVRTSGL